MKGRVVLFVMCCFSWTQLAFAVCKFPRPRSVCAEYSASKLVVEATLVKIDPLDYNSDLKEAFSYHYTLRTDRTFRGAPGKTIRVYGENSDGHAPFEWKLGTKYILFLSEFAEGPEQGLFEVDACGNSRPLSQAKSVLKQIASAKQRRAAFITGMVIGTSGSFLSDPLPNIEVVASGDGATYKGTTDKWGGFSIEVPPGHYTVKPVDSRLSFSAFDLSYEGPDLAMEPGSCAQTQFVGKSRR